MCQGFALFDSPSSTLFPFTTCQGFALFGIFWCFTCADTVFPQRALGDSRSRTPAPLETPPKSSKSTHNAIKVPKASNPVSPSSDSSLPIRRSADRYPTGLGSAAQSSGHEDQSSPIYGSSISTQPRPNVPTSSTHAKTTQKRRLWPVKPTIVPASHTRRGLDCLAFSPTGEHIAAGHQDGAVSTVFFFESALVYSCLGRLAGITSVFR